MPTLNKSIGAALQPGTMQRLDELLTLLQSKVPPGARRLNRSALIRGLISSGRVTERGLDAASARGRAGMVNFTVADPHFDALDVLATRFTSGNRSRLVAALIETAHQTYIQKIS